MAMWGSRSRLRAHCSFISSAIASRSPASKARLLSRAAAHAREVALEPRVAGQAALDLAGEDVCSGAALAGVEEEEAIAQRVADFGRQVESVRLDRSVRLESEGVHPAVGGRVLVLLADCAPEVVKLDCARGLGQRAPGQLTFRGHPDGLDGAHRVGARGAEPGAGRDVALRAQLEGPAVSSGGRSRP